MYPHKMKSQGMRSGEVGRHAIHRVVCWECRHLLIIWRYLECFSFWCFTGYIMYNSFVPCCIPTKRNRKVYDPMILKAWSFSGFVGGSAIDHLKKIGMFFFFLLRVSLFIVCIILFKIWIFKIQSLIYGDPIYLKYSLIALQILITLRVHPKDF